MRLRELAGLELDLKRAARQIGRGRSDAQTLRAVARAWELARGIITPRMITRWLEVLGVEEGLVLVRPLEGGAVSRLDLGPRAGLMAPARLAQVAACTIGSGLDRRVERLRAEGREQEARYLDSVGVVALGEVADLCRRLVEQEAARRGWGVSLCLMPGSLQGWDLAGQRDLCVLLDLKALGARLLPNHFLVPHKSSTSLIGLGPGYEAEKVESACRWCHLAASCWRRW